MSTLHIIICVLVIIILVMGIIVYNLYTQVSQLESELVEQLKINDKVEVFYTFLLRLYSEIYADLIKIDRIGAFRADDEVGYIFNAIKESIEQIKVALLNITDPNTSPVGDVDEHT